jgi:hypothetical protein
MKTQSESVGTLNSSHIGLLLQAAEVLSFPVEYGFDVDISRSFFVVCGSIW